MSVYFQTPPQPQQATAHNREVTLARLILTQVHELPTESAAGRRRGLVRGRTRRWTSSSLLLLLLWLLWLCRLSVESRQLMEAIRHHQVQMQQLQQQQAQMQQQQQAQQPQVALQTAGIERQSQQQHLNMRGFDDIETISGGEDPKAKLVVGR